MSKTNVKLNLRGINQIMTGRGATAEVVRRARRIQAAAGENFEVNVVPHKYTARAFVRPKNVEGAVEEARSKTLTKAFNAGRG